MKKPIKIALYTVSLICILIGSIPAYIGYSDYQVRRQGESLARKIDAFEVREGHVPVTLQEIGERYPYNTAGLTYYASSPHHYTIRYMNWASATYVFDSTSHKWEFSRS